VVLAPFGGHPGAVPGLYDADFGHVNEFLKAEKDPAAMEKYLDKYVYSCKNHQDYLDRIGRSKLEELMKKEIREGYYE